MLLRPQFVHLNINIKWLTLVLSLEYKWGKLETNCQLALLNTGPFLKAQWSIILYILFHVSLLNSNLKCFNTTSLTKLFIFLHQFLSSLFKTRPWTWTFIPWSNHHLTRKISSSFILSYPYSFLTKPVDRFCYFGPLLVIYYAMLLNITHLSLYFWQTSSSMKSISI